MLNEGGDKRVIVTKDLPGDRWKQILLAANCRVEVCTSPDVILSNDTIKTLIGSKCDGVIGQLTEVCEARSARRCVVGWPVGGVGGPGTHSNDTRWMHRTPCWRPLTPRSSHALAAPSSPLRRMTDVAPCAAVCPAGLGQRAV